MIGVDWALGRGMTAFAWRRLRCMAGSWTFGGWRVLWGSCIFIIPTGSVVLPGYRRQRNTIDFEEGGASNAMSPMVLGLNWSCPVHQALPCVPNQPEQHHQSPRQEQVMEASNGLLEMRVWSTAAGPRCLIAPDATPKTIRSQWVVAAPDWTTW